MDANRFDSLVCALPSARSRRGIVRSLAGLTLAGALAPLLGLADAEARNGKKKKRRRKKKLRCEDGVRNGSETDVDCGGRCPRCATNKVCGNRDDCATAVCTSGTCQECSTEDAICGRDANGVTCFCKRPNAGGQRVCITGNATGAPVANCELCPPGTICVAIGTALMCFKPCSAP